MQQVPDEGSADAEAHHHAFSDAQVIHHAKLVVGIGVPGPIDCKRAGGLAAIGVAQIRRNHAFIAFKFFDWVERRVSGEEANGRIQTTAGDE